MTKHVPVLLQEIVEGLDLESGEIFVDATYGAGGHTQGVRRRYPHVKTMSIDCDPETGASIVGNFRDIDKLLGDTRPDAILFDLGISSDQLGPQAGGPGRGFSFLRDEPLLMTLSKSGPDDLTAEKVINTFSEEALELIIRGFGEERYSARIAKEIVERREKKPLKTTFELRDAIFSAVPDSYKRSRINPATRTFQAIRIATNEELTALEEGLEKAYQALRIGGRIAVISFHSLEDRIVKNYFRKLNLDGCVEIITKKPITPSEEEIASNPRARSAKLRIAKKIK